MTFYYFLGKPVLMLFCQLLMIDPDWLLHGIRGRPKILKPFRQKNQDEIIAKLLGMPAGSLFPFHLTGDRDQQICNQFSFTEVKKQNKNKKHPNKVDNFDFIEFVNDGHFCSFYFFPKLWMFWNDTYFIWKRAWYALVRNVGNAWASSHTKTIIISKQLIHSTKSGPPILFHQAFACCVVVLCTVRVTCDGVVVVVLFVAKYCNLYKLIMNDFRFGVL